MFHSFMERSHRAVDEVRLVPLARCLAEEVSWMEGFWGGEDGTRIRCRQRSLDALHYRLRSMHVRSFVGVTDGAILSLPSTVEAVPLRPPLFYSPSI